MKALERQVREGLLGAGIKRGARLLAAVSGGPDSTALLCALAVVCPTAGIDLRAGTVDHGIRPAEETGADVAFLTELCGRLHVSLTVARIGPGACRARAEEAGRSLEEVARELRLGLLRDMAREGGSRDIALGHTRDDVLETLLMRVLHGSDPEGLRGIAPRRGPFVRPLLRSTRVEVTAYLRSLGQEWREDPSNRDERFLRNRVRNTLVPVLDASFGGWRTGLVSLAKKMGLAHEALQRQADTLPWKPEGDAGWSIDHGLFSMSPPGIRARSLLAKYDLFRRPLSPRRLPWRFLAPVLGANVPPGIELRGHGVSLETREKRLFWGPDIARQGEKGYFIEVFCAGIVPAGETGLRIRFARSTGGEAVGSGGLSILEESVFPPLVLRSKRKGDRILLPGGVTSVKELLDGWGVAERSRERVPLLADRRGVLAVLGGGLGHESRLRDGARTERCGVRPCIIVGIENGREEGREQQQR